MPSPRYSKRSKTIYTESEEQLEAWEQAAKEAKMGFNAWMRAVVEEHRNKPEEVRESPDQNKLQEDNRKLRHELEKEEARLRELEAELFKAKHESLLNEDPGEKIYSEKLVLALQSGGTWTGREILKELDINMDDSKAMQIVTAQLQALQDFGLVSENQRGWKWIR
jgi:hypothetical protein